MSDTASPFDLLRLFDAFPSLKYAFALGAMLLTLRWMWNADRQRRLAPTEQSRDENAISRIERKINRIEWNIGETRRDIDELINIVRPGARTRSISSPPSEDGGE